MVVKRISFNQSSKEQIISVIKRRTTISGSSWLDCWCQFRASTILSCLRQWQSCSLSHNWALRSEPYNVPGWTRRILSHEHISTSNTSGLDIFHILPMKRVYRWQQQKSFSVKCSHTHTHRENESNALTSFTFMHRTDNDKTSNPNTPINRKRNDVQRKSIGNVYHSG